MKSTVLIVIAVLILAALIFVFLRPGQRRFLANLARQAIYLIPRYFT